MNLQIIDESSHITSFLEARCRVAQEEGRKIDLTGCSYGKPHWKSETDFITEVSDYYYFLAGFVRSNGIMRVMEIGTHCGGSIRSMIRGVPEYRSLEMSRFVTADISFLNQEAFVTYPDTYITRLQGDVADPEMVKQIELLFKNQPIDLLFIDADHSFEVTSLHINIFVELLKPQWLILDDIHLNASMERLWQAILWQLGDQCFDATTHSGRGESGLGVVLLRA